MTGPQQPPHEHEHYRQAAGDQPEPAACSAEPEREAAEPLVDACASEPWPAEPWPAESSPAESWSAEPGALQGLSVDPLWDTAALSWLTANTPADEPGSWASPPGSSDAGGETGSRVESAAAEHASGGSGAPAVELMFAGVEQWVADILAPTFPRRATSQFRWCAQWWRHPEAVLRLEALWRSWEACRAEPMLGISAWLRDHLDPQLAVLTAPAGAFAECDPTRHFDPAAPALLLQPAPEGWWDTPDPDDDDEAASDLAPVGDLTRASDLSCLVGPDTSHDMDRDTTQPVWGR